MYKGHPLRSLMFVPAHKEELLKKSLNYGVDILLPDLEDSVQPKNNKAVARRNILNFVKNGMFNKQIVFPRINDRESGELLKDLYELTVPEIDGFMFPKAKKGEDIYFIDKLLETIEYEKGYEIGSFKIIPIIETSSAVLHAEEIAKASNRVIAIAFGNEDYLTDLEGINDYESSSLFIPRNLIALAARSAGVIPIDTVHINVHDLVSLESNILIAKKLGFEGMLVLNPKELELVHKHYTPNREEYEGALEMVKQFEIAAIEGTGVTIVNGKFIGPPLVKQAKKIIDKYEKINLV